MAIEKDIIQSNSSDLAAQSNLTRSQFLIWLGQTLAPDAPLYNMIQTFTFTTALDAGAFQRAFAALVASSDALRTVIDEVKGVPQQRVRESLPHIMDIIDLSAEPDPQAAYNTWLEDRRTHLHDLGSRLFDSALLKLGDEHFIWYLNQHHLITDGWSFLLVYRRMSELYQQILQGTDAIHGVPTALPAYAHYISHEHNFRESAAFAKAETYWLEKLTTPSQPLTFYDRTPRTPTHRTERVVCDLGAERTARLKAIAGEKGIQVLNPELSIYNVLVTLFTAWLHRISGNSQITLGSPFHNRPTPAFKETIGVFIEVCSLRLEVAPDDSFMSLLQKVMQESMNVLRYALPGTSRAEYNRAYEVLLNFVNMSFPPFAGMQPEVEWVHSGYGDRDHALRLQIHDFNGTGSYKLHFDFNTHIFTEPQRELAIQHFLRVVDAFLENREQPITGVSLLTADEHTRYVEAFNQSAADYPADQTIVQLFEVQVERTPEAPAVRLGTSTLTFVELNARANQLAHHLRGMGVVPGVPVAISMEHSLEVVIAILGVLKAGGAYVPIDPTYPPDRAQVILDDLGQGPIFLTQPHLRDKFAGLNVRLVTSDSFASGETSNPAPTTGPDDLAYILYTSGSTGKPKGVMIEHRSLVNYIWWARAQYLDGQVRDFPLFSSLSFDLTVTSIFTPLITGGQIVVYPEDSGVRGMSILKVIEDGAVDVVKLTPAHLTLIREMDFSRTRIKAFIVGGEDFKTELARAISGAFNQRVAIYNEYGPTEATVGCMIHRFDPAEATLSVPVGVPGANAQIYVLDAHLNPVPTGVIGEMYIGGHGLARGYLNRPELTAERFIANPFQPETRLYKTGDLARWTTTGKLEFLGRADHQVKVGGARIELGEIESRLAAHPQIKESVVTVVHTHRATLESELQYCTRCGLASNFPGVSYDDDGVCHLCRAYDSYKDRAQAYFKPMTEMQALFEQMKANRSGEYDCVALFSGGKDSTYMVAQLVAAGLKVLTFTLDNGYISEQAKANIRRVAATLKVDHIFGTTPAMNAIFVDSLKQFANVCNGCFKTIYTLSVNLAREKGIRYIITGLSRGQFFETRLTPEVFQDPDFNVEAIDKSILAARKAYHRRQDVISRELDVDAFRSDAVFEDIQFIDFYRYCDVSLGDLYAFLDQYVPWVRPSDTGRSTNCIINDVGIYLHKKQRGYHNYALPYSWDVRMGHKQRDEALNELHDAIDEAQVKRIMGEIGYTEPNLSDDPSAKRLAAYYVADGELSSSDVRAYLSQHLPDFMLPSYFIRLDSMPLTRNGKIDRANLPDPQVERPELASAYQAPETALETQLATIWSKALNLGQIGVHDNFFELGGSSLPAIQVIYQVNQRFGVELPVPQFFENPTISQMSAQIEDLLIAQVAGMSDDDAARLLASLQ